VAELPRGTVTFAFTDIEGSTALLKRLDDDYGDVLAAHRRLVRDAFGAYDGVEIDTQGDAFFFAFPRARDAVAAAARVQRDHVDHDWPHDATVRVRIGLHTGEPTIGEEGYLGLDVVRAARLSAIAQGGHVLLSETTRALIGSKLPDGVSVFPVGERHLKDIDEAERVYELEIVGVDVHAPDVAAPPATPPVRPAPQSPPRDRRLTRKERKEEVERRKEEMVAGYAERAEEFAQRTTESILGMIERKLGDLGRPKGDADAPGAEVELGDVTIRADELARRAQAGIRKALEERGWNPDGS
jgi:class 3 adenylate cyclase